MAVAEAKPSGDMLGGLRHSYWRIRRSCGLWLSRQGDRLGIERLTYNAVVFEAFSHYAAQAAPGFVETIRETFPGVRRVVDIGCGTGHFVHAFRNAGVAADGCEYSPRARQVALTELGVQIAPLDLSVDGGLAMAPGDLAMSLEVAEHVPPDLGDRLVALLVSAAPLVIFTAATLGQGGTGHINEQPQGYWIERFARHRFEYDEALTAKVRRGLAVQVVGSPWIAKNVMIFRRLESA